MVVIITAGWFWFVQPRLWLYLRSRTDTAALEERVRTLQQASDRAQPAPAADLERTRASSRRASRPRTRWPRWLRRLAQAGARERSGGAVAIVRDRHRRPRFDLPGSRGGAHVSVRNDGSDGADPRLALFPYAVSYTPLRVSFDSTFEATANVLWQLRDLPTVVDVRSATLTRGLPLMKTELLVRVLQRGDAIEAAAATVPAAAAAPVPGPTAPRLAPSAPDPGAAR